MIKWTPPHDEGRLVGVKCSYLAAYEYIFFKAKQFQKPTMSFKPDPAAFTRGEGGLLSVRVPVKPATKSCVSCLEQMTNLRASIIK